MAIPRKGTYIFNNFTVIPWLNFVIICTRNRRCSTDRSKPIKISECQRNQGKPLHCTQLAVQELRSKMPTLSPPSAVFIQAGASQDSRRINKVPDGAKCISFRVKAAGLQRERGRAVRISKQRARGLDDH